MIFLNDEIVVNKKKKREYSRIRIGLVLFFYLIMMIALFKITSLRHIYNYFTSFLFLIINMISSIYVIGFQNRFLMKINVVFYIGLITFTTMYTFAIIITWLFIQSVGILSYTIFNFIIVFLYLTACYIVYSFGVKNFRK